MIRICRAEDGEIFEVEASLRDIELCIPFRYHSPLHHPLLTRVLT
jgi:hypothetical protein